MAGTGIQTLCYSPQVRIKIATRDGKNYDLSADVVSGSIERLVNSASTFTATLNNRGGKYTGKLSRMDRVTIFLKKTVWLQVFTGYLTQVPAMEMHAKTCTIRGQCTIKKLLHTYWDPGLSNSSQLLVQQNLGQPDAGIGDTLIQILTQVGGWDASRIHIQQLPKTFLDFAKDYATQGDSAVAIQELMVALGFGGAVAGVPQNPVTGGVGPAGLEAYLYGLRMVESGGNYKAKSGISSAAGAYQYIKSSWNNYRGYVTADLAPSTVQDARASSDATNALTTHSGWTWENVAALHLTGSFTQSNDKSKWDVHPGKGNPSIKDYVAKVIAKMNSYSGGGSTPATPAPTTGTTEVMINPISPNDKVNSKFGPRTAPKSGASTNHKGVDLQAAMGTKVMAAASGKVFMASPWANTSGNTVAIYHGNGVSSYYLHLSLPYEVSVGQQVTIGQEIARSGNTGDSTGPHLHFEVHISTAPDGKGGSAVDPEKMINQSLTVIADPSALGSGNTPAASDSTNFQEAIFNALYMNKVQNAMSMELTGQRAFANDEALMTTIQALASASLRNFMSAPNGDFVAFFPDHFGLYGVQAKVQLEEVEMIDVHIDASDGPITTHVYAFGDTQQQGSVTLVDMVSSGGFVNILQPYVFNQLLNLQPTSNLFFDAKSFLERFGLRPLMQTYPQIKNPTFEYFMALQLFLQKWADQYLTTVQFTFMPELYPGMRVNLANWGISVYVQSVTHTWNMASGFSTTASISSPSATGPSAIQGLPIGRV